MGKTKDHIEVKVLKEDGVLFSGPCDAVIVPSAKDDVAILPYHTPLIMLLTPGQIKVVVDRKIRKLTDAKSGILYVGNNQATVLVDA